MSQKLHLALEKKVFKGQSQRSRSRESWGRGAREEHYAKNQVLGVPESSAGQTMGKVTVAVVAIVETVSRQSGVGTGGPGGIGPGLPFPARSL